MIFPIFGLAKGTKAVFQALIIPDYVPLERLPTASGIQMVCNGILSISVGPIIGRLKKLFVWHTRKRMYTRTYKEE